MTFHRWKSQLRTNAPTSTSTNGTGDSDCQGNQSLPFRFPFLSRARACHALNKALVLSKLLSYQSSYSIKAMEENNIQNEKLVLVNLFGYDEVMSEREYLSLLADRDLLDL